MVAHTMPEPGFFDKHREKIAVAGADECWLWTAGKNDGYGWVKTRGKTKLAHRLAFESVNGDTHTEGLVVRHKCDVRACVNPAHLELGTYADNNRDMMDRGRHVAPKGSAHGQSKLTENDVRAIRADYIPNSRTHGTVALGRQYGVSSALISDVIRRARWAHI